MRRRSWNVTLRSAGSFAPGIQIHIHTYTYTHIHIQWARFLFLFYPTSLCRVASLSPSSLSLSLLLLFSRSLSPGSKHASKIRINASGAATEGAVYVPSKSNDKLIARAIVKLCSHEMRTHGPREINAVNREYFFFFTTISREREI